MNCSRSFAVLGLVAALGGACAANDDRDAPSDGADPLVGQPATAGALGVASSDIDDDRPATLDVEVIEATPHDTTSFTEGLAVDGDRVFESSGGYGTSDLREVDPETGLPVRLVTLDRQYFAEGLALVDGELIQLTWNEGVALRYDADTFEPTGTFTYGGEGWGLCYDGSSLYMTNGSSTLYERDAATFEVIDEVTVTRDGAAVDELNELECADGVVYSNVWFSDEIVRIEADTGVVTGVVDASGLLTADEQAGLSSEATLNGIADLGDGRFLLTGKEWPRTFEVRFVDG